MTWVERNIELIGKLALEHLSLAFIAILLSVVISIPAGWLAHHWTRGRALLIALIASIYAIPSLPMFIIVPAVAGTALRSYATMIIVLTAYGVAVLTRSVADAFAAVPNTALKSATAMGFGDAQKFWKVELPLAAPVIFTGMRIASVSTVSLVTVGAVVGIRSLGTLFTDGFQRGIYPEVISGLIATIALALLLDTLWVVLERILLPWSRHSSTSASAWKGLAV